MREAATREWRVTPDDTTGEYTIQFTARPIVGPVIKATIACTEVSAGVEASNELLQQVNDKRMADLGVGVTVWPVGRYDVDARGQALVVQPPLL